MNKTIVTLKCWHQYCASNIWKFLLYQQQWLANNQLFCNGKLKKTSELAFMEKDTAAFIMIPFLLCKDDMIVILAF